MFGILDGIIPIKRGDEGFADILISGRKYRLNPYTPVYINMQKFDKWGPYFESGILPSDFEGYVEDFVIFRNSSVQYDLHPDGTLEYLNIVLESRQAINPWLVAAGLGLFVGAIVLANKSTGKNR